MNRSSVIVHIYDLASFQIPFCALLHTGVEYQGVEFSFAADAGVFECPPRSAANNYRRAIPMGCTNLTSREVRDAMADLRMKYSGEDYDILTRNCNHFCDELCWTLLGCTLPSEVRRLSVWARLFGSCIPRFLRPGGNGIAPPPPAATPLLFGGPGYDLHSVQMKQALTTGESARDFRAAIIAERWAREDAEGKEDGE